jgi:hypothetical protein
VPGTFTYTPASGAVLNAGNGQTLSVSFTPTDAANYASATKTATINVAKADQTISWTAPAAIGYGTALSATQLNATTTGDGALSYNPASGAVLNAGTHTLTVTAAGTTNYNEATRSVSLTVNKADQVIAWNAPRRSRTARPSRQRSSTRARAATAR